VDDTRRTEQQLLEDLTERKQAEEARLGTEIRYRLLFDHSPDGIVIIDPDTMQLLEFNETAHRQLGYSRAEFARLGIPDIDASETPDETKAHIQRVISRGWSDFETLHRTRQGEIRHIHVTAQYTEKTGHPVYHCIWRDITERKRTEEELRKSAENYRSLASILDSIFLIDRNYIMIFANENFLTRLSPHNSGPMIGESIDVIHHPLQAMAIRKGVDEVFSTGKPYHDELWGTYSRLYLVRTFSPILDERGQITAITVTSKDMTRYKLAEMELQKSEAKYRSLASIADRLFVVDKDCRFLFANDTYLDAFGPERDSVIGRGYDEWNDEEQSKVLADAVKFVFDTGDVYHDEYQGRRTGLDYIRKISPITNADGSIGAATVILIDITDRKRAEAELKRHRRHLEDIVAERTAELEGKNIILHELNAALKVLLKKREDDKKDIEERFVANIHSLVLPYVELIKKGHLDVRQLAQLDIMKAHIREIATPLLKNLGQFHLTPKEIKVAALVRQGRSTKEIIEILGIGSASITVHRKNIRRKLGLSDRRINLESHLAGLEQ
jgi:PAS domain S-box-containing protein